MRAQTTISIQHARIARFAVAVVALVVALGGLSASARAQSSGNTVTEWNEIAASAPSRPRGSRHTCTAQLGDGAGRCLRRGQRDRRWPPAVSRPRRGHPADSKRAAAATAAYRALVGLFPTQQATLKPLYDASLAACPTGPEGRRDRRRREAAPRGDARGARERWPRRTVHLRLRHRPRRLAAGRRPTSGRPAAWVGNVHPFLVPNVEMLRTDGPNALTSAAYAEDFNEVKEVGSLTSTSRTADQTAAAIFWQDSGPAIWNRVFRALAASQGLDIVESARMLAMTNLAAADGSIGCWNDKYYWNFWRPITAIREAAAATATRRPSPTRPGCRCSTRPFPSPDRRSSRRASPTTRRGTPASAGRPCTRCKAFFGTDKVAFTATATSALPRPVRRGASTASRTRSRRSSTPASGAGSTSAPPTCRARCSARRSLAWTSTISSR